MTLAEVATLSNRIESQIPKEEENFAPFRPASEYKTMIRNKDTTVAS